MAVCEKCWEDAYFRTLSDPAKSQYEHYVDLLLERRDTPCSAEEQAGEDAGFCIKCERHTVNATTHKCVICG